MHGFSSPRAYSPQEVKSAFTDEQRARLGLGAMCGAAGLFSVSACLGRAMTQFTTFQLIFWQFFFVFLGTLVVCAIKGQNPLGPQGSRDLLIARGFAGFGSCSAFYASMRLLPISEATAIISTSPVLTGLLSAVVLGESWGCLDALGSMLCLVGVLLDSKPPFVLRLLGWEAESHSSYFGIIVATTSAVLLSFGYLLLRKVKDVPPLVTVTYLTFVVSVAAPCVSFLCHEEWVWPEDLWTVGQLALVAALFGAGHFLQSVGLSMQTAGKATAMMYLQVVFAFGLQLGVMQEPADILSVTGAGLISSWGGVAVAKETLMEPTEEDAAYLGLDPEAGALKSDLSQKFSDCASEATTVDTPANRGSPKVSPKGLPFLLKSEKSSPSP